MSETTSVEGVLAAHTFRTGGTNDAYLGHCYRHGCPALLVTTAQHAAHQADELRKAGLVGVTCQVCRDTGNVGTGLGQQCGACAPGSQAEHDREVAAKAWDEGHGTADGYDTNPYRKEEG